MLFPPTFVSCPWYVEICFPWLLKIGQILQRISQDQCNSIRNVIAVVIIHLTNGTTTATPKRSLSVSMIFSNAAQKVKFSIKDFFSKCECHMKKSLMENFFFCAVKHFKFRKSDIITDFVWFYMSVSWSKYLRYTCFDFSLYILFWNLN